MAATDAHLPTTHPASKTALLLCDFIKYTVGTVKPPAGGLEAVQSLLHAARASKVLTVHCLTDGNGAPAASSKMQERWTTITEMMAAQPELLGVTTELDPEVSSTELVMYRQPGLTSALYSIHQEDEKKPTLRSFLHARGISHLVIAGVTASGVVLSTARSAGDQGFVVSVVRDAVWDRTREAEEMMFERVLPISAYVVGVEEAKKNLAE